jgi:hypothetical protein
MKPSTERFDERLIDPTWDELANVWQTSGVPEPTLSPERLEAIKRRARWGGFGLTLLGVFETLLVTVLCLWLFSAVRRDPSVSGWIGLGLAVLIGGITLTVALRNRRGLYVPADQSTLAFLELLRGRILQFQRTAELCPWLSAGIFIPIFGWRSADLALDDRLRGQDLIKLLELAGSVLLILAICCLGISALARRRRRELKGLDQLIADLQVTS